MNKAASIVLSSMTFAFACSSELRPPEELDASHSINQQEVIVGQVNWIDTTDLDQNDIRRERSSAVAFLGIPRVGSRCSAFMVTPDVLMTNEHCVSSQSEANGAYAVFEHEKGRPDPARTYVSCERFIGANAALDMALLGCASRPGDTFGTVTLSESTLDLGDSIYLVHQNCDYHRSPGCDPTKKVSPGTVAEFTHRVRYDADTLSGSSGGAVFDAESNTVIALHNLAWGSNNEGRGFANSGIPMTRILPYLRQNHPSVVAAFTHTNAQEPAAPTEPLSPEPTLTPDVFEPNDSNASASAIRAPTQFDASIHDADDVDFYRFSIDENSTLRLTLGFDSANDLDLALYQAQNPEPIATSQNADEIERIERALSAGEYTIIVYGYQGARDLYRLTLESEAIVSEPEPPVSEPEPPVSEPPEDFEPNDTFQNAAAIALDFEAVLEISEGDVDHFRVESREGLSFQYNFEGAGEFVIRVRTLSGEVYNETYHRGRGQHYVPVSGEFVIDIRGFSNARGVYALKISDR